jgi:hypothetical protein
MKLLKRSYFCKIKKNLAMKNFLLLIMVLLSFTACKTKVVNTDNLPKDISLKPENNLSQQEDRQHLSSLIREIEMQIQSISCDGAADWAFSPIGAKHCGGPTSYIAYPKNMESQILPEIKKFTEMQSAFNKKYNLMSDCKLVTSPTGVKCIDGEAVLVNENSVSAVE